MSSEQTGKGAKRALLIGNAVYDSGFDSLPTAQPGVRVWRRHLPPRETSKLASVLLVIGLCEPAPIGMRALCERHTPSGGPHALADE